MLYSVSEYFSVVCPYLPDIINHCAGNVEENEMQNIVTHIEHVLMCFSYDSFTILAQGVASSFAMHIAHQFGPHCRRVLLCNPLCNFEITFDSTPI